MGHWHQRQPAMLVRLCCAHVSQAQLCLEDDYHGILDLVGGYPGKKCGCCYSHYSQLFGSICSHGVDKTSDASWCGEKAPRESPHS